MKIDLESCFVGFLIGVAIYLLLNKFFGVEGIRKHSGGNVLPTPGMTQAQKPCMTKGPPAPSPFPFDNYSIKTAVKEWLADPTTAGKKYGHISRWDVSSVTDMNGLFSWSDFNENISCWDVSSVTDMGFMFYNATSFNQDLRSWNVSSVTDMKYMFDVSVGESSFNGDISGWNVSKVKDMSSMFFGATKFNQDIRGWDVSSVTEISNMFDGATGFKYNLCLWKNKLPNNLPNNRVWVKLYTSKPEIFPGCL